jgi:fructose-1,6-bisphosphatase/inositol monophosphatase family enzyme
MRGDRGALVGVMREAAAVAAASPVSRVDEKSTLDYVTDVDHRLDAFLGEALARLTPGVPVLSEEQPIDFAGGAFWIVDPLDGTHNLMAGLPFNGVCAALFDGGVAVLSAVLDLSTGIVYSAERGRGATADDRPLVLAPRPSTLVAISSGAIDALIDRPDLYRPLRRLGKLRNLGSQSLHLVGVALDRFGFALSAEARFWDDAAARLIAEEAGARYVSFAADDRNFLSVALSKAPLKSLCAHPALFDEVAGLAARLWGDPADPSHPQPAE